MTELQNGANESKLLNETKSKILLFFMDYRGVVHVHHESLPEGGTVNTKYYLQVMRRLREGIYQKRPDLWPNNSRI